MTTGRACKKKSACNVPAIAHPEYSEYADIYPRLIESGLEKSNQLKNEGSYTWVESEACLTNEVLKADTSHDRACKKAMKFVELNIQAGYKGTVFAYGQISSDKTYIPVYTQNLNDLFSYIH